MLGPQHLVLQPLGQSAPHQTPHQALSHLPLAPHPLVPTPHLPPPAPRPQTLPGSAGSTTTCAALVDEDGGASCRLFTAGLDGTIQEQNLDARRPCASCDSFGGAVWQLVPEPLGAVAAGELPRLAAACDDGCVRLFSVDAGVPGAAYAKSLPRVEGRVLAVAWHAEGKLLASAGTDGCIHVWQLDGNRELLRITAGAGPAGQPKVAGASVEQLLLGAGAAQTVPEAGVV